MQETQVGKVGVPVINTELLSDGTNYSYQLTEPELSPRHQYLQDRVKRTTGILVCNFSDLLIVVSNNDKTSKFTLEKTGSTKQTSQNKRKINKYSLLHLCIKSSKFFSITYYLLKFTLKNKIRSIFKKITQKES